MILLAEFDCDAHQWYAPMACMYAALIAACICAAKAMQASHPILSFCMPLCSLCIVPSRRRLPLPLWAGSMALVWRHVAVAAGIPMIEQR
jgi:hypothetical protein